MVVHQLAQRKFRELVSKEFKEFLPDLSNVDEEEMYKQIERDAEEVESKFFEKAFPDLPVFDFEIN